MKAGSINHIIFYIGFALLFLLQETEKYNVVILILLSGLFLFSIFIKKKPTLKLPLYFVVAFLIYLLFLIEGLLYRHLRPGIDVKFQFFIFLLFLIFINAPKLNYVRFFIWMNVLVLAIYILLYLKIMPSFWSLNTIGFRGRLYGPALISFIFIAFDYLYRNKSIDKNIIIAFIISVIYILMSTNFMNLLIVVSLMFLIVVDLKKLFSTKILVLIAVAVSLIIAFINSPYVPILVQQKLQYVSKPWEYPSFKIRIEDFKKAVATEKYTPREILTGKGFGASTTIYRENKQVEAFSRFFRFQEIDNGFYYIFHRGGWFLLLLFILTNTIILLMLPNLKTQLAFFLIVTITNLLSIHYFNYYFYVFLYFYILTSPYTKKLKVKFNRHHIPASQL